MKILHVCLSGYYSEGWGYQDNLMTEQNVLEGHEVHVIASQFQRSFNNQIIKSTHGSYVDKNFVNIHRLEFKFPFLGKFNNNIRIYKGLYNTLQYIGPDIIFVHGIQFLDINIVSKYVKKKKLKKVYADNHAMHTNSAKSFISKYILHRIIYKHYIKKNLNIFRKIFYINESSKRFLTSEYKIKNKLEFFPLCGRLISIDSIEQKRQLKRSELKIPDTEVVFVHAGKLNKEKRTLELIRTFNEVNRKAHLIIVGSVSEDIALEFNSEITKNKYIHFVGWKNTNNLIDYLCCADVLVQPGSQSIIFQQALSCGLALILKSNDDTKKLVKNNNGLLINKTEDLKKSLVIFMNEQLILAQYKSNSYTLAIRELNYGILSKKYVE